jgi:hypothetical protein
VCCVSLKYAWSITYDWVRVEGAKALPGLSQYAGLACRGTDACGGQSLGERSKDVRLVEVLRDAVPVRRGSECAWFLSDMHFAANIVGYTKFRYATTSHDR